MSLLDHRISPHPMAIGSTPFTAIELDEHVEGPRIWATILEMRDEIEGLLTEERDAAYNEAEADNAANEIDYDLILAAEERFTKLAKSFTLKDFERFRNTFETLVEHVRNV